MRLIVDAEVIFAALIARGFTLKLIKRLSDSGFELLSPEYVLEEINRRKSKIQKFSGLNEPKLNFFIDLIFERITLVRKSEYESFIEDARYLAPHSIDVPYFALALAFNCPIWSNEKRFKNQKKIKIYTTEYLKRILI